MYLRLDLSVRNQVTITRFGFEPVAVVQAEVHHAQALGVIADALIQWGTAPADIQGIGVIVGVGAFTATRVATTIANAWAYVYGIPVIGITGDEVLDLPAFAERFAQAPRFLSATYSGAPAIGRPSA